MKNFSTKKISALLASLLTWNMAYATESHDNVLSFQGGYLQSFAPKSSPYNDKTYNITSGQPCGGVVQEHDGQLHVLAGRHLSKDNVNWVKSGMSYVRGNITPTGISWGKFNMYGTSNSSDTPSKLNFAIYGDMILKINQVNYFCPNIYIVQGSSNLSFNTVENWWIFSNNDYNQKHTQSYSEVYVYCYLESSATENAILMFTQLSPKPRNNTFAVEVINTIN